MNTPGRPAPSLGVATLVLVEFKKREAASDEQPASDSERASTAAADATVDEDARLDSVLPFTKRLPEAVTYDGERHALHCASCEARYDPTSEGMADAIRCCHSLETVTRDDVPICELNLKLSVNERRQSPYTDAQFRFLQAVHTAHQRRFNPDLEYDPLHDSMIRLQEYVGERHRGRGANQGWLARR